MYTPKDTMSSYRSWSNNNTTTAPATEASGQPSNPFGNMRKERNHSYGQSYSDWKSTEQKKKMDAEKSRPLTDADFPPLGGEVRLPVKVTVPGDGLTLAARLSNAIKRQEDEALRRRLEQEEEEQKSKETVVSISLGPKFRSRVRTLDETQKREAEEEEENYRWQVSSEMEAPAE